MKRFVAICLLVVCVALPLFALGGTAQSSNGSYVVVTTTEKLPFYVNTSVHSYGTEVHILNQEIIYKKSFYEPHTCTKTVVDRMPNLNLKLVKCFCKVCHSNYLVYEPIDPSKPYAVVK